MLSVAMDLEREEVRAAAPQRQGPTRNLVVPGNWASVQSGKWHLVTKDKPQFREPVTSLCGVRFEPQNVTWGDAPPTNDYYICAHCAKHL
jgi:hypothetical protein